jgi:hypothetical protein
VLKARELFHNKDYKVAVQCSLMYWFPKLVVQVPGYKDIKAFE